MNRAVVVVCAILVLGAASVSAQMRELGRWSRGRLDGDDRIERRNRLRNDLRERREERRQEMRDRMQRLHNQLRDRQEFRRDMREFRRDMRESRRNWAN